MMQQGFDINRLLQEAHVRWLKPSEVFFILQNHEKFVLTNEPPTKPPSGSLFLFNKRILRYFRKDGHIWRKKKDGRNIGEGHERLKVGNADALTCYYARGEQNPYFQRRIFWMLDSAYEHIVLVHYREVEEGRYAASVSNMSTESSPTSFQDNAFRDIQKSVTGISSSGSSDLFEPRKNPCSIGSLGEVISTCATDLDSSQQPDVNKALRMHLNLADDDTKTYFGKKLSPYSTENESSKNQVFLGYETRNCAEESLQSVVGQCDIMNEYRIEDAKNIEENANGITSDFLALNVVDQTSIRTCGAVLDTSGRDKMELLAGASCEEHYAADNQNCSSVPRNMYIQLSEPREFLTGSDNPLESPTLMSQLLEIGNPAYYMPKTSSIEAKTGLTMDASGIWFGQSQYQDPLVTVSSLTLAQKQLFNIREISPEWAFSYESTKVIIVGDHLCDALEGPWAVMFGDTEVPVEIVQSGVFCCQTPEHAAGKVSLCITSGNRESCSQIREFEFRLNHNLDGHSDTSLEAGADKNAEEMLIIRFAQLLLRGYDHPSILKVNGVAEADTFINSKATDSDWELLIEAYREGRQNQLGSMDWVLQELLKDKLHQWLLCKSASGHTGTDCLLSKQEQSILHIISGLGYEWALSPILSTGVGINFRDARGWTALHWAAHFGREKMVASLLAADASARAVTDPTSQDRVGKTPASIAALRGHKGLAGYLSEAALTTHLTSLTLYESEISKGSAAVEAEKAVESISQRTIQTGGTEDQLSLKDSLAAVRNAAQAAARIQAAFRSHSFRKKQRKAAQCQDECGLTPDDIDKISAAYKLYKNANGCQDTKSDIAAIAIQKKYRGWKRRKTFLSLRQNVVKIQAHVRGHQMRKKYKEFVSMVSILEKIQLRWLRKGVGLRGYRAGPELLDNDDEDDIVKVFRKTKVSASLEEALSRVVTMVDYPEARQQYRRMLECYRKAKAGFIGADESTFKSQDFLEFIGSDDFDILNYRGGVGPSFTSYQRNLTGSYL